MSICIYIQTYLTNTKIDQATRAIFGIGLLTAHLKQ